MVATTWRCALAAHALAALPLLSAPAITVGQTFSVPLVADTTILNNDGNGGDTEDNFGARAEIFSGSFISGETGLVAPRSILLRFDVSSIAAQINDPNLIVTSATLTLDAGGSTAGDQRVGLNNSAAGVVLDVFGLVPQNSGWLEGEGTGSSAAIDSGEFGSASARFLSTPSAFANTSNPNSGLPEPAGLGLSDDTDLLSGPGVVSDGVLWFSQGGGQSGGPDPLVTPEDPDTFFSISGDTTNASLTTTGGSTIPANFGTNDGDLTFSLGATLTPLLSQWLAAGEVPSGSNGVDDGGMTEASNAGNAGLVINQVGGPNSQVFFSSTESAGASNPEPTLSITFGPRPVLGDYDNDGDVALDGDDYDAWADNFGESGTFATGAGQINPDGNLDGFVNAADYTIYRDGAGAAAIAGGGAVVPEPAAAVLLGLPALAWLTRRRNRNR